MNPDDLDRILNETTVRTLPDGAQQAAIARAETAILGDLHSVKPLASFWALSSVNLLLFAVVGVTSASILGLHGFHVLNEGQRGLIFTTLLVVAGLASAACAREMRPTGMRFGWFSLLAAAVAFPMLFAVIFRDYSLLNFVHEGVPCLVAGVWIAILSAPGFIYLLRRGFVMEWRMAGLAAGTLSGLTGLAMLEIHCPNLKAIHVMTWHVAVVVVSAVLGYAAGWATDRFHTPEVNS